MATPLPPNDHYISLDDAIRITTAWRDAGGSLQKGGTFAFHRIGVDRIMKQPGCVGMRAYAALKDGNDVWVLVGVDDKGNDMLDELAEDPFFCPPYCPDGPLAGTTK